MNKRIYTVSMALALSLCGCTASEKTQMNGFGKDASSSLKTLSKDASKVGQAITSSDKDQEKDKSKSKSKSDQNSKPSDDFQKDATKAMTVVGNEGTKAGHAIASAVNGLGKDIKAANKTEKGK